MPLRRSNSFLNVSMSDGQNIECWRPRHFNSPPNRLTGCSCWSAARTVVPVTWDRGAHNALATGPAGTATVLAERTLPSHV
jgi:hypothetical protein